MSFQVERYDHVVLTVINIEASIDFYTRVMGMEAVTFDGNRRALHFGQQKINLHEVGKEDPLRALRPTSGSGDLCFITRTPLSVVLEHLKNCEVEVEVGPVERIGALGPMMSVYFRDPDNNLIEVANY
jgi:catechol 2,3-dioxygenase-like lactoylglutathione lyase family enzyme